MKFEHVVVYRLRDLNEESVKPDQLIDHGLGDDVKGTLTADVDAHARGIDQELVIRAGLLRGIFAETEETLQGRIDDGLRATQDARRNEFGEGAYCVITITGDIEEFVTSHGRDEEMFSVYWEAADKDWVRRETKDRIYMLITALALSQGLERVSRVTDGIVFYDKDSEHPYYSVTPKMGVSDAYIQRSEVADLSTLKTFTIGLHGDSRLRRVAGLLAKGLETRGDRLEAFVYLWASLELLVDGIYSDYESIMWKAMEDGGSPLPVSYADRIRSTMKSEHRLHDKFLIVAAALFPQDQQERSGQFNSIRAERNDLAHRGDFDVDSLPLDATAELCRELLKRHLQFRGEE